MRFTVGKFYWRVKGDGGIYEFFIDHMTRTLDKVTGQVVDSYYCEGKQVIVDRQDDDPLLCHIFDSYEGAMDFVIARYESLKSHIRNQSNEISLGITRQ